MGIIYAVAYGLKSRQQKNGIDSQYFIGGLTAKLIGVTAFCLVYGLYYGGGDTVDYYHGSVALANLMTEDFAAFYSIVFENELSGQNWYAFNTKQDTLPGTICGEILALFAVSRYSAYFVY